MTKSGSLVTTVKEKKLKIAKNHLFSRVIWSKKIFFEFGDKNDNLETAPKK